jgi:hypothetical protein
MSESEQFLELVRSLLDTYRPEGVLIWLQSRNRHFSDRTPLEVLRDEGWQPLLAEADRLAGGPTRCVLL